MNYLELCQRFVADHGISGGTGPTAVTGQVGELRNVCNWIADAATDIDNLWLDWKYLWRRYAESLVINDSIAPAPSATGVYVRLWAPKRMKIREVNGQWTPLTYMVRVDFEDVYDPDNATPGMPSAFTIMPDNSIQLNCKADAAYQIKGEFWRRPVRMAVNADLPLIPAEYFRLIIARAGITYGNREDAPEVISGAESEWLSVKDKLESEQLEDQERRRSSTDRGADSGPVHQQFLR